MNLVLEARKFAIHAHEGQKDKIGTDYFSSHVEPVANYTREYGGTVYQVAAAYLHDTVEDTGATLEEIHGKFGFFVADVVSGMTKRRGENYMEFIYRLVDIHPEAVLVKLADIRSNTDPLRMMYLPAEQRVRLATKYAEVLPVLWEAYEGR